MEVTRINDQVNIAKRNLGRINADIQNIKKNLAKELDSEMKKIQKEELKTTTDRAKFLKKGIQEMNQKKTNVLKSPIAFEEFLSVLEELPRKIQKVQSTTELDSIISKIFLNFYVSQKNVEKYTLKAPFGTLKQACETDVSLGGPNFVRSETLL